MHDVETEGKSHFIFMTQASEVVSAPFLLHVGQLYRSDLEIQNGHRLRREAANAGRAARKVCPASFAKASEA
jgi:hypothetical protein